MSRMNQYTILPNIPAGSSVIPIRCSKRDRPMRFAMRSKPTLRKIKVKALLTNVARINPTIRMTKKPITLGMKVKMSLTASFRALTIETPIFSKKTNSFHVQWTSVCLVTRKNALHVTMQSILEIGITFQVNNNYSKCILRGILYVFNLAITLLLLK